MIKQQKDAKKEAQAESFEEIANDIRASKDPTIKRTTTTVSGHNMAKGFALAFMAKAMALNKNEIDEIEGVKDKLAQT